LIPNWDIRFAGVPYVFGKEGGIRPGKAQMEPGQPLTVETIMVPTFHHGPGQLVGRDPGAFHKATKVNTSRQGLVLPAGNSALRFTSSGADFDGIHGAGFCQVNDKVF
jgi:hypothetical protein